MDFCRLNACFGVSRSYCMGVLAFVWGTEAYNGEICDFFIESSRWSSLFRRPSTCYIRKHLTHSGYYSPDFVLCIRVICRMWARLRSSLWEKDDFPSSKPPIASAMISNWSNNGFLLCAVFFSMLTAFWPPLWRVKVVFLCSLLVKKYLGKDT